MHVSRIEARNFRGIREMTLDLPERICVFAGRNGSGKSSLLDLLAIMLSRLTGRIRRAKGAGRQFTEADIHAGASGLQSSMAVKIGLESFEWQVTKTRAGRDQQYITNQSQLKEIATRFHQNLEVNPSSSLPLCVYYGVNRAVLDVPLRIRRRHDFDQLAAYDEALSGKRSVNDFRLFFEWFRNREDIENEAIRHSGSSVADRSLNAVRKAIEKFTDLNELCVRRQPLRMEARKGKMTLRIEQLSDGEKCLLAMIGDLARRLSIANPGLPDPLKGEGVVLIDEIDLHLHPAWQRKVMDKLPSVFPKLQFIVSTHSPQVISHVKPSGVYLLSETASGIQCLRPDESYGMNADRVLEDLMGVDSRPAKVEKALHDLFVEIDGGRLEEARKEISRLIDEIGDDPELLKARVLIKRREYIGK